MKKETIQKTIEILKVEEEAILRRLLEAKKHYPSIGNFTVYDVFSWYPNNEEYTIKFKNEETELDFEISEADYVGRLSWSSWNYSSIHEDNFNATIQKSKQYISSVAEMLDIMEDKENTQKAVNEIVEYYKQIVEPLKNEGYEKRREIEECEEAIKKIEENEFLEEAKKVIVDGAEFYFYEVFRYKSGRWNTTCHVKVNTIERGKYKGMLIDKENNFRIDDNMMKALYIHITAKVTNYEYPNGDYSNKKIFKRAKNLLTKEQYENKNLISWRTISEEEYDKIRYGR